MWNLAPVHRPNFQSNPVTSSSFVAVLNTDLPIMNVNRPKLIWMLDDKLENNQYTAFRNIIEQFLRG